jgi:hypothetical protein
MGETYHRNAPRTTGFWLRSFYRSPPSFGGLKISLHIAQRIVGKIESFVARTAFGFHYRDNLVDDLRV